MKVEVNEIPKPLDTVVSVSVGGGSSGYRVDFEPTRTFYARHLLAVPRWLIGRAFRIAWHDFKLTVRGHPPRPLQTVADFEQDRQTDKQLRDQPNFGTYVEGFSAEKRRRKH